MPIAITSEHNDLADSVRSLVARVAPSEVLHEALETPISNPPPYWAAAADQGLQGLHLSEAVGGQGFGILELAMLPALNRSFQSFELEVALQTPNAGPACRSAA